MKRFKISVVSLVLTFCLGLAGTALGQDEAMKDLNDFSCKDIMRLSGSEREGAIAILHGFLLGKKGTGKFDVKKLGDATDAFIEQCLDNPNEKALGVMEKATQ